MAVLFKTICVIVIFIANRPLPNKIWLAEASEHVLDPVIAYRASPDGIGRIFQWKHSNNIDDRNNWLNGDVACDGDWVHMERDNNPTVIMFSGGSLKADVIDLPTDGVMFFSNERKVVLGEKDKWQCNKRKSSEDIYFQLMNAQPNFYDAKNWLVFEKEAIYNCNSATECDKPNTSTRLDAEQVPGQWDDVIFPSTMASQVYIDSPIHVQSFNFSNKLYSTTSLYQLLLTVEGQLQFRLGPDMKKNMPIDNVDFQWPDADQFRIGQDDEGRPMHLSKAPHWQGEANSNIREPYITAICKQVRCIETSYFCSEPVTPVGQCCPQCGAVLTFRQTWLNFTEARRSVMKVEADLFSKNPKAGISFIKLDQSDLHPLYQIAVIANDSNNYDKDLFYSVVNAAFQSIQKDTESLENDQRISSDYFDLKVKYSTQNGKIHWGKLFKYVFFVIILAFLAGMAFRYQYKHSPRLRLLLSGGRSSRDQLSANWQRAREMLAEESRVELRRANRRLSLLFGQLSGNHHQIGEEESEAIQELSDRSIFHAEFANQAFNDAITEEDSQSTDITDSQTKIIEF